MRIARNLLLILLAAIALVGLVGWRNARADPIVRRLSVGLPDWPAGAKPVTIALASDIHMESAAMDGPRLLRIAGQINALRPDLIVLAGDFIEGRDAAEATRVAPLLAPALGALKAPLGVVAVLGNHDYWTDGPEVQRILKRAGIVLLRNRAIEVGPLAIVGIDDSVTGHARLKQATAALSTLPGARIAVVHSPGVARAVARRGDIGLLLSGHTHCGQVVLPWLGAIQEVVEHRYMCGVIREGAMATVVTAGLGTSEMPLRYDAPPDLWLVTLGPKPR